MKNEWCEPLTRCAEGLYVLEEESRQIVYLNDYLADAFGTDSIGQPCWRVFLERDKQCPFCPRLSEEDGVYTWDCFDSRGVHWVKVKQLVFSQNGVRYRAGNVNLLDDVMQLNLEAVQGIATIQAVVDANRSELVRLERAANFDTLTGLNNRNCLYLDLEHIYAGAKGLGVLYFDLNNLKETNDDCGHAVGDLLLRRVAEVLRRLMGHLKGSKAYRIGGDEFVLLASEIDELELANLITRFNEYIEAYNKSEIHPCIVAVGHAFSKEGCNPEILVSEADSDMHRKKQRMKGLMT